MVDDNKSDAEFYHTRHRELIRNDYRLSEPADVHRGVERKLALNHYWYHFHDIIVSFFDNRTAEIAFSRNAELYAGGLWTRARCQGNNTTTTTTTR